MSWGTYVLRNPCPEEPMSLGTNVLGNPCPEESMSWVTHIFGNSYSRKKVLWHPFSRNSLPQNWLTVKLKQHQRRTFGLRAPLCKFRRPGLESWLPIFLANYYKGEKNGWIYLLLNKIGVNSRCTKCFQENLGNIKPGQRSLAAYRKTGIRSRP